MPDGHLGDGPGSGLLVCRCAALAGDGMSQSLPFGGVPIRRLIEINRSVRPLPGAERHAVVERRQWKVDQVVGRLVGHQGRPALVVDAERGRVLVECAQGGRAGEGGATDIGRAVWRPAPRTERRPPRRTLTAANARVTARSRRTRCCRRSVSTHPRHSRRPWLPRACRSCR